MSACTPDMMVFIHREMRQRVRDVIRILLQASDGVWLFRDKIKMSCIIAVPQEHLHPRLILNLLENHD